MLRRVNIRAGGILRAAVLRAEWGVCMKSIWAPREIPPRAGEGARVRDDAASME